MARPGGRARRTSIALLAAFAVVVIAGAALFEGVCRNQQGFSCGG